MIFPIPAGVHPNSHICGCEGLLLMPWVASLNGHALKCTKNPLHNTYQKKNTGTRKLFDPERGYVEVYVATGKETAELATLTESTALAKVTQAHAMGLFPSKDTSPAQLQLLAQVALAYRLDPLMGEIMPYQGRPYITIAGRRRLDASAGHHPSISYRLLTTEETQYYTNLGALNPGDVAGFCVLTTEHGNTVEGFGRVLENQRSKAQRGADHLPTVVYVIEMAQKRQERRAREMAYGPVPRPAGLDNIQVLEEGDETGIIEGEGRLIPSDKGTPETATYTPTETDYGFCPVHTTERWATGQYGPYHKDGAEWCRFSKVQGVVFKEAVLKRHGAYDPKEWNDWLKTQYGNTWSKLTPEQMLEAIKVQTTIPPTPTDQPAVNVVTGELPADDLPE